MAPPQEESKLVEEPPATPAVAAAEEESGESGDETPETTESSAPSTGAAKKKKKSKKSKGKKPASATTVNDAAGGGPLPKNAVEDIIRNNPALASEWQGMDKAKIEELLRGMKLQDLLTGMASGGKNQKDMASYKFWATQPVARFGE
jgi:glycylpeptide N-tetradecanoyltransferase